MTLDRPMGLPIMAGCDSAWNLTRVSSDASSMEMQCLRPLHHLGGLRGLRDQAEFLQPSEVE